MWPGRGWVRLLALLLVAGAGELDAGELHVGVVRFPASADPMLAVGLPDAMLARLVFQGLVAIGERGDVEPALARGWSVSRDGLTWTFRLRPGVQFHDGSPLTAADVVTALSRHLGSDEPRDAPSPWARLVRGPGRLMREVRAVDPGTVQIQLSQPHAPLLAVLAHPAFGIGLPAREGGDRFVGTGPFRFVTRDGDRLVLEAFGRDRADGPRVDRLVLHEVADDAAGLAGLAPGGPLHVYVAQAPPGWSGLGLQVVSGPSSRAGWLALRTDQGLLARKAARQAVALALDPGLVMPALGRWAVPFDGFLPPGTPGGPSPPPRAFDPARARRLLGQAGAGEARVTLAAPEAPTGPDLARLAEAIRLSMAPAGLTVDVRLEPADASARGPGDADLALVEVGSPVSDPHFHLAPLLLGEAALPGGLTNVARFRSPAADGILVRAGQLGFRPERLRLYQRLERLLGEEVPYVPLYVRLQWLVARPTVRGLVVDPGGLHRLERVWVDGDGPG